MPVAEIDLSIFRSTFFDEALEHVADIEAALLELEENQGDRELLNRIFRGAHSIKGGSGTFGLNDVTCFTHALESLLDPLRDGTMQLDETLADLLFRSTDVLQELLVAARAGTATGPGSEAVLAELRAAVHGPVSAVAVPARVSRAPKPAALCEYRISFVPHAEIFMQGMDPVLLLRNLCALGDASQLVLEESGLPELRELDPERCYLRWSLRLRTDKSALEVADVFAFVEDASQIEIEEIGAPRVEAASAPRGPAVPPSTLRVSTDKLDRLVNLVGELVIAQSMITQSLRDPSGASIARLEEAAVEMERNTRELQDLVMSVRMVPM